MIDINNVTFSYGTEDNESNGIENVSLKINKGEVVVLCGASGCGKTTVTRLINGLIPHYYEGKMSGNVLVGGKDVSVQQLYDTAEMVGSVFQNPRSQFFNVDTTGEITFGCENMGMPEEEIRTRLQKIREQFDIDKLLGKNIFHLSGGQKQKIACAGASIIYPEVFVLDEPSSNLDAASIKELGEIIRQWKNQGRTVVISEHRLYYLKDMADRFVYMKDGHIEAEYSAEEFKRLSDDERHKMGLRSLETDLNSIEADEKQPDKHFELKNFKYAYKYGPDILKISDVKIPADRIVAIIGDNGAGKSTFARCLCGLEKRCGVLYDGQKSMDYKARLNNCYMVMQDVNHQLFSESVLDEVLISMDNEDKNKAENILKELDIYELKDRHPMSLSGGQKQRVAVASAIASKRSILIFDEPTSGLDYRHMIEVGNVLRNIRGMGESVFVITHDPEFIEYCCTDVLHLKDGSIAEQYPLDRIGVEKLRKYFRK